MTALGRLMIWSFVMDSGVVGPPLTDFAIEGYVTVVPDVDTIVVSGRPVRSEKVTAIGRDLRSFTN